MFVELKLRTNSTDNKTEINPEQVVRLENTHIRNKELEPTPVTTVYLADGRVVEVLGTKEEVKKVLSAEQVPA